MDTNFIFIMWTIVTEKVVMVMHFENTITYFEAVQFANQFADFHTESTGKGVAYVVISPRIEDRYYWNNGMYSEHTKSIIRNALDKRE